MNISIRFAKSDEFQLVRRLDPHSKYIDPKKIQHKLDVNEIIIALESEKPIGILKFSYFWATRPYMDLIWLKKHYRGQGIGQQLLSFFEEYLITKGYFYLITSSEKDELAPQRWHQKQGFVPCGEVRGLNLPESDIAEVFFQKKLQNYQQEKLKEFPIIQ